MDTIYMFIAVCGIAVAGTCGLKLLMPTRRTIYKRNRTITFK